MFLFLFDYNKKYRADLVSKVEIGGRLGHNNHEAIELKVSVDRRRSTGKISALDMRREDFRLLSGLVRLTATGSIEISLGPLQDEDGHLTNRERDKTEMINTFFVSVFNMDDRPRRSQYSELEDHDCQNDQLPLDPELVEDLLLQLDPYKPMEPDGIHPRILQ
ncbi:hypothetical protein BTVI_65881 [Pitangus sulphuratus]|nr:hypothetical protein BTVI_65881 [Pitangus sulphuratus]